MGFFSSNNNNDDRKKRDLEYEIRDIEREVDSIRRERDNARDKWFSFVNVEGKERDLDYWDSMENKINNKLYYYEKKLNDLEYELRRL